MDNTRGLLQRQFSAYSKNSVIVLLGSLNVLPENHSQRHRLTTALQAAVDMAEIEDRPEIQPTELASILSSVLVPGTEPWNMEDPQEALFTELILFHGGNHIVFPEVFTDSLNGLKNLADTIFMTHNQFSANFKREIFFGISTLLKMSNDVAVQMGYPRYMTSPERHHEPIFFPEEVIRQNGRAAIKFNFNEIVQPGLTGAADRETILRSFTCAQRSGPIGPNDEQEDSIQTRPLYRMADQLIVINIHGICAALVHFIVVKIYEYNLLNEFITEYKQLLLERSRGLFRRTGFDELDEIPAISKSHPLFDSELGYRFDDDKLAWITLIPDLFRSYDMNRFFTRSNELIPANDLARRKDTIKEWVENKFPGHELLFIDLFIPVGREYRVSVDRSVKNLLHLSFSDLRYILLRDSGSDGLSFWRYLLAYNEQTDHAQIQAFSFLDRYAFFKDHRDNFYVDDELRYPSLMIPIGYANSFREEAYSKTDIHLVPLTGGLAEVEKRFHHREIGIYIPNDPMFLPRQFVKGDPVSFWLHIQFRQRSNQILRQTAWMLMESTSYWLWEANAEFQEAFIGHQEEVVSYELKLLDEEKWSDYNFDQTQSVESVSNQFRVTATTSQITMLVPFELAYLINGFNNNNDRVVLRWLVIGFNNYLTQLNISKQLNVEAIVEKYAPRGKKTMMQGFDTLRNPMLHPHKLPEKRFVEDFEIEALLNDLGIKAAPDYPVGDINDAKEKNKLSNLIVAYYFKELKKTIAAFPYLALLKYVLTMNESLWYLKHMTGHKSTSRLACFEKVPSMRAEIIDENMEIEEATLALRCLIEIIVAIPPSGDKIVNNKDFDRMLALTKEIITWGTISDELNFGVNEVAMGILPSGRVGISKEFLNHSVRPYNTAKKNEAIDERIIAEEIRATIAEAGSAPKPPVEDKVKEAAFQAEFGFNWSTFLDILMLLVELGFETEDGIITQEESKLIGNIKERYPLSDETIISFLNQFSLAARTQWEILPEGYKLADAYPWRYSRPLSLMRKPLIRVEADGKNYYYWGMRQALLAYQYIDDLIADGRYNAKTPEMRSYISGLLDKKGKKFTKDVFEWLSSNAPNERFKIDREVKISERGKLIAEKDYGDIDVLIIDLEQKKIISIECKHITPARITSEFASELKKFESDWIGKHTKRHKWLTSHIEQVKMVYQLPEADNFEVKSIFLTSEKVPFPFITKTYKNLPFFDFSSWKRDPSSIGSL